MIILFRKLLTCSVNRYYRLTSFDKTFFKDICVFLALQMCHSSFDNTEGISDVWLIFELSASQRKARHVLIHTKFNIRT